MTVSISVMTPGEGYLYLLNSVVNGDGDRDAAKAITRYYQESGTPPAVRPG
ncbi:hypothetical protein [Rathayibacter toxicus]|uniref:hypothetical protein n=1 Tax=Rathayibacter toxicus TaxID=145458 RepID=UPI0015E2DE0E|nr:hypothetical protein [Rathayibacter toxicus]QOD09528.1 hypothetical protein BSG36_05940 [Rathayibacter toxicus]